MPVEPATLRAPRVAVPARVAVRTAFAVVVATSLVGGILGGLLRVGIAIPATTGADWLGNAAAFHAALMVCGFLGTAIGLERAVAAKSPVAYVGPVCSGIAGLLLLWGVRPLAAWLFVGAATAFVAVNVGVVRRQPVAHTRLLLAGASAWLVGCLLFACDVGRGAPVPWWFAFLVTTIAAERLEMTRLRPRAPAALPVLCGVLLALFCGAALFVVVPAIGGLVFGLSLVLLAGWLAHYDVARRTVRTAGLSRYMAVCLLTGYAWLAAAGVAWAAMAFGLPLRDVALHALGLGFVVGMAMGHAPVILPALTRVKVRYGPIFYLPLVALHGSLLFRLVAGSFDFSMRAWGALSNALAILSFVALMLGAALAWRLAHGRPGSARVAR